MALLARLVGGVLAILMAALIALITVQIVLRFVFSHPLPWSLEVSRVLFVWIAFLGAALAIRRAQYSSMDIVSRRLPAWWSQRAVVVAMVVFSVLLAFVGTQYVRHSDIGRLTLTGLPDIIVFVAPAVSGVLMSLFSIELLLRPGKPAGKDHPAGPPESVV